MNDAIINDYLDEIDRQEALRDYDQWRRYWLRGMVSDAELTAFLSRHEAATAHLYMYDFEESKPCFRKQ